MPSSADFAAPAMSPAKHPAGVFEPVVDARRCAGKAACVAECPYDVFIVRRVERSELPSLGLAGTFRWWLNGGVQAAAARADRCHACGLCVSACPEQAITLRRVPGATPGAVRPPSAAASRNER